MRIINIILSFCHKLIKNFFKRFNLKYIDLLEDLIQDCNSLLDLGCGYNSPLGKIKKINQYSVGVDIFEDYIKTSKDKKIPPKSFDCILLLDVIEHLKKSDAINLLKKIEKISKKK